MEKNGKGRGSNEACLKYECVNESITEMILSLGEHVLESEIGMQRHIRNDFIYIFHIYDFIYMGMSLSPYKQTRVGLSLCIFYVSIYQYVGVSLRRLKKKYFCESPTQQTQS